MNIIQQCFEHIVVTRPDTAALKPRGPVVQGVYHPSPPEGAGDRIGALAQRKHPRGRPIRRR
jgi:hypothetical protein